MSTPSVTRSAIIAQEVQPLDPLLTPPLTTAELRHVLTRRVNNMLLPDDNHTFMAEAISSTITVASSMLTKVYFLNSTPVQNLQTERPRLMFYLMLLSLSQLRPLRLLQVPLLRAVRPLQWLLSPFVSMASPTLIHIALQQVLNVVIPFRRQRQQNRQRLRQRQLRTQQQSRGQPSTSEPPQFVQDFVEGVNKMKEKAVTQMEKAREKLQNAELPKPPRFELPHFPNSHSKAHDNDTSAEAPEQEESDTVHSMVVDDEKDGQRKVLRLGSTSLAAIQKEETRARGLASVDVTEEDCHPGVARSRP